MSAFTLRYVMPATSPGTPGKWLRLKAFETFEDAMKYGTGLKNCNYDFPLAVFDAQDNRTYLGEGDEAMTAMRDTVTGRYVKATTETVPEVNMTFGTAEIVLPKDFQEHFNAPETVEIQVPVKAEKPAKQPKTPKVKTEKAPKEPKVKAEKPVKTSAGSNSAAVRTYLASFSEGTLPSLTVLFQWAFDNFHTADPVSDRVYKTKRLVKHGLKDLGLIAKV